MGRQTVIIITSAQKQPATKLDWLTGWVAFSIACNSKQTDRYALQQRKVLHTMQRYARSPCKLYICTQNAQMCHRSEQTTNNHKYNNSNNSNCKYCRQFPKRCADCTLTHLLYNYINFRHRIGVQCSDAATLWATLHATCQHNNNSNTIKAQNAYVYLLFMATSRVCVHLCVGVCVLERVRAIFAPFCCWLTFFGGTAENALQRFSGFFEVRLPTAGCCATPFHFVLFRFFFMHLPQLVELFSSCHYIA